MPNRLQSRAEETASASPLGDQRAGESGAAAPISSCAGPSGVPTYSAYAPLRSLRNARRPSTGLHCGKRLFEPTAIACASAGSARGDEPDRPAAALVAFERERRAVLRPARVDVRAGAVERDRRLRAVGRNDLDRRAGCARSRDRDRRSVRRPDRGPVTSELGGAMPFASCWTSAPLAEETASTSPSRNAICVPSGDQVASVPGTLPTWRSLRHARSSTSPSRRVARRSRAGSRARVQGRRCRRPCRGRLA